MKRLGFETARVRPEQRENSMNDARPLIEATAALWKNLGEFPAMFAKSVVINIGHKFHTATATLVDFGRGPLALTCFHVIAPYHEEWKSGEALIRVGNTRVLPSQLAALDGELDLATIRLSDEQAADLVSEDGIAAQFYQPTRWPLDPAREGEPVAVGGFPAQWRRKHSKAQEIIMPYYGIGATAVTSASERLFGCRFERSRWVWMSRRAELADLTMLGGLAADRSSQKGTSTEHWLASSRTTGARWILC